MKDKATRNRKGSRGDILVSDEVDFKPNLEEAKKDTIH